MITLTGADNGADLTIDLGDVVEILLPQVGGTAYVWHLEPEPHLDLIDDQVRFGRSDAPGSASDRVLRLRAVVVGRFTVRASRYRPWESALERDAEFVIRLEVTDPATAQTKDN